jgi:small subunit ribosomal protein S18
MARPQQQTKRAPKEAMRRSKKVCQFCKDRVVWIDYKDVNLLRRFMSDRGKIRARRVTGNCAQHQRDIAVAIKTSREVALLPYAQRTSTERTGRGPRPDRRDSSERDSEDVPSAAEQLGVDVEGEVDDDLESGLGEEVLEDA